jgi:hypothetical protein
MKIIKKYKEAKKKEAEKQAKAFAKKHGGNWKKYLSDHIKAHERMEKENKKIVKNN